MKSNNSKYRVRELTYDKTILVGNYLYLRIFDDLKEVEKFINQCKKMDNLMSEYTCIYIIEVFC